MSHNLDIFTAIGIVFVFMNILYIISLIIKRNDIADVFWGVGIFLSSITLYLSNTNVHQNQNIFLNVALILIFLWAIRIFLHIGIRFLKKKEEDFRYKNWRITWKFFYLRSYFQIYILQGFLMFLMSLGIFSIIYFQNNNLINDWNSQNDLSVFLLFIGIFVSLFGLLFEAVADLQLKNFLTKISNLKSKDQNNKNQIMTSGVWKYSRHPNYFGEITFWFGIFILSINSFTIISFLFSIMPFALILFLLLKVSGIPMLEEKYIGNKEFDLYKEKTPALIPNFFIK